MPTPTPAQRSRRYVSREMAAVRIENRAEGDAAEAPAIVGYAAVFYDGSEATEYRLYDDLVERIMPGAFDEAITRDDVRGLYNHDPNQVLGRTAAGTMKLAVDAKGLRYEIDPPDTQAGRDTRTSIARGDVSGSSFGFIPSSITWREEEGLLIREVHGAQLFDVGPVTFPAYTGTSADSRSADADEARAAAAAWKAERDAAAGPTADQVAARARVIELDLQD